MESRVKHMQASKASPIVTSTTEKIMGCIGVGLLLTLHDSTFYAKTYSVRDKSRLEERENVQPRPETWERGLWVRTEENSWPVRFLWGLPLPGSPNSVRLSLQPPAIPNIQPF